MNKAMDFTKQQQGWVCPRCKKVNAPWMVQCSCLPEDNPQVKGWQNNLPVKTGFEERKK